MGESDRRDTWNIDGGNWILKILVLEHCFPEIKNEYLCNFVVNDDSFF